MKIFSPEDRQVLLDWSIILALGWLVIMLFAVVLGLAIRLFIEVGGI